MNSWGMGGERRVEWKVRAGKDPKAGYTIHWNRKAAIVCVLIEVYRKGAQCTC